MSSLRNSEKRLLLEIARRALVAAVERRELREGPADESSLTDCGGAFVTLRCRHRLRGCIGQIGSDQPLVQVIARSARAAALEDPRFDPVRPEELVEIDLELSVLSPLEEVTVDRIEVGKHGLMVTRSSQRGVLLPQVATERRWSARRFLEETCVKAGFQRDAWKWAGTVIQGFTAEIFSESDLRSGAPLDTEVRTEPGYSAST
jgi:uncharacterized protein